MHMEDQTNIYIPNQLPYSYFVKSIWRLRRVALTDYAERILPKGTVELIFNLSDQVLYINQDSGVSMALPDCFVNGLNLKPFTLKNTGEQYFLGMQLNTLGIKALFRISALTLNNNVVEGDQLCSSLKKLKVEIYGALTFDQQVYLLLKWLDLQLTRTDEQNALERIFHIFLADFKQQRTVSDLQKRACISDRQLRRWSLAWLGICPENFLSYQKYLNAIHKMHQVSDTLTEIGLSCGYYDQAHFIREFKHYTDMTPFQYKKSAKGLPGHVII